MTSLKRYAGLLATAAFAAVTGLAALALPANADGLPFRDGAVIRLVVPYGPGGGFDRILRLLQPSLEKALNSMDPDKHVSVIVENRKGAGGRVAYEYTYASPPDGTRIVLMGDQGAALQQVALGAKFDLQKFTYLALVNASDWGILIRKDTGIKTMNDIIARSHEKSILWGTAGAGGGDHIGSVILRAILTKNDIKLPVTYAHFSSSVKVMASMQRDEAEAYIGSVESVLPAVQDGYGVMAVVFGKQRSPYYPDTPTIFEQKIPGAEEISKALGISRVLVAPPGLPEDRKTALVKAFKMALTDPDLLAAAKKADLPVDYGTPEEALAAVKDHSAGLVLFKNEINEAMKGQ